MFEQLFLNSFFITLIIFSCPLVCFLDFSTLFLKGLNSKEVLAHFNLPVIIIIFFLNWNISIGLWFFGFQITAIPLLIFREDGLTYKLNFCDRFWKLAGHLLGIFKEN